MVKLPARAPLRLLGLLMLAMVFSATYYGGLAASHGGRWWKKRAQLDADRKILEDFQQQFVQCVRDRGMGLDVRPVNECQVKLVFTDESAAMWRDMKTGELEGLVYTFDVCSMISLWEQVRNSTTILTEEYIDGLPNGWRDYAWRLINKGHSKMCSNITVCKEKLALVLPRSPPFVPRQYSRCAVVGNSGDLLQDLFGAEIDEYDAVIRMNGAPVENYTHYVGEKTTFRVLNRGSAKALDRVASMATSAKEVLIVKTTVHDITNRMIQEVPIRNPVYLMVGIPLGLSAKGTGVKAIQFAISVCQQVDIYGFTVDPGYHEWSVVSGRFTESWMQESNLLMSYSYPNEKIPHGRGRKPLQMILENLNSLRRIITKSYSIHLNTTRYFSESRIGHAPLQGRAYYQTMECLGLIRIHSPQRRASTSLQPVELSSSVRDAAAHLAMPIH